MRKWPHNFYIISAFSSPSRLTAQSPRLIGMRARLSRPPRDAGNTNLTWKGAISFLEPLVSIQGEGSWIEPSRWLSQIAMRVKTPRTPGFDGGGGNARKTREEKEVEIIRKKKKEEKEMQEECAKIELCTKLKGYPKYGLVFLGSLFDARGWE